MTVFVRNGRFLNAFETWEFGDLAIDDGRILRITEGPDVEALSSDPDAIVLDVEGNRVGPGFIDLQINGGWGIDLQTEPEGLWRLGEHLTSVGVTAFVPTLTTNGFEHLDRALAALEQRPAHYRGAEPLGWHLEGPWLSEVKRGAHALAKLQPIPDPLPEWCAPDHGVVLVTLDPELPGASAAVRTLRERAVVVSYGHTAISEPDAAVAFGWGAGMGTHLFNAMVGLHHRDPGLAAALLDEHCDAYFGVIVDGQHVAPAMVAIAWRLAPDRFVLVSDAVAALGMTDAPVFRLGDGTLAGSVTSLDRCVLDLAAFAGCSDAAAHRAASTRPAEVLGDTDRGLLWPGMRADVVVLDDDGTVSATVINGNVVYRSNR